MASKVGICNLALGHLGQGQTISDIDTEQSNEAKTCRVFFEVCKNSTLRDFTWPFATKFKTLDLVEEDPTDEWSYAYRMPNDCLDVRRILSGIRNDNADSRIPYIIAQDNAGLLIYTDLDEADIEYTAKCENPVIFPPDFEMALSFRLAAVIAPRITAGDQFKLGIRALELYNQHIARAIATAKNEEQKDKQSESSFIRARE